MTTYKNYKRWCATPISDLP